MSGRLRSGHRNVKDSPTTEGTDINGNTSEHLRHQNGAEKHCKLTAWCTSSFLAKVFCFELLQANLFFVPKNDHACAAQRVLNGGG